MKRVQQLDRLELYAARPDQYVELDLTAALRAVAWLSPSDVASVYLAHNADASPIRAALRHSVRVRNGAVAAYTTWRILVRDLRTAFPKGHGQCVLVVAIGTRRIAIAPVVVGLADTP